MSFEATPTNGNGRWYRSVPLMSVLGMLVVAGTTIGILTTQTSTLAERVKALEANSGYASIDARVRLNTEYIKTLQADYAGHLDKSGLQWSMLQADIAAIKSAITDLRRKQ